MGKLIAAAFASGGSKLLKFLGFTVVTAPVSLMVTDKLKESIAHLASADSIALAFMTSAGVFEGLGIIASAIVTISVFNATKVIVK